MFDVSSFYRVLACNDDIPFLGRVFGEPRFLGEWLFSLGRRLQERFLT
jgi:hypothetical protein